MKDAKVTVMNVSHEKEWFSQKEAAKAYGVSESLIKRERLNGNLPFSELFGKIIINKRDIERNIVRIT